MKKKRPNEPEEPEEPEPEPEEPDDPGDVGEGVEGYPQHVGGGYYELSNGERVQGKESAEQAESELGD